MTATTNRIAIIREWAYHLGRDATFVYNVADDAIRARRALSVQDVRDIRDRTTRFRLGAGDALLEGMMRPIPDRELGLQNYIADAVADVCRAFEDASTCRSRKNTEALRHAADTAMLRLFAIFNALNAVPETE